MKCESTAKPGNKSLCSMLFKEKYHAQRYSSEGHVQFIATVFFAVEKLHLTDPSNMSCPRCTLMTS